MEIKLVPVSDENKEAVLALSVREDQPFVAPNNVSTPLLMPLWRMLG